MKKLMIIVMWVSFLQIGNSQLETQKAKFLYSMLRYIEWPEEINKGSFKIGVLGSFDLYGTVAEETLGRKIGNLNIEVLNISRIEDIALFNLHILMVSENNCTEECFKKILTKTENKPTLIICETENTLKTGAGMCFITNNQKLIFKMNRENIKMKGIEISNQLELYANKF